MARLHAREGEEIWETTTDGTVWVTATDDRGKERHVKVGGKKGSRLRIRTIDREIAQDNAQQGDPFTNGMLVRVDAPQDGDERTASPHAMTTDQLLVGFAKNGAAFQSFVNRLNEFNTRRMAEMAAMVDATSSQIAYLQKVIREKYRIHGDTPTYRELHQDRDTA